MSLASKIGLSFEQGHPATHTQKASCKMKSVGMLSPGVYNPYNHACGSVLAGLLVASQLKSGSMSGVPLSDPQVMCRQLLLAGLLPAVMGRTHELTLMEG